jgi:regulatory protein
MAEQTFFDELRAMVAASEAAEELEAEEDDYKKLMSRAGRVLARRPHSRAELAKKLGDSSQVGPVLDRLTELRLLDDADFARRWVEERSSRRGRRALLHELYSKGIDREVAEAAVERVGVDEESGAQDLAARYLRRVASKPPKAQAASMQAMLLRRGYSYEAIQKAIASVLPPEGWD